MAANDFAGIAIGGKLNQTRSLTNRWDKKLKSLTFEAQQKLGVRPLLSSQITLLERVN